MLHGYGDNAANFMHLAEPLDQDEWGMHYISLNAPSIIIGNPMGYQWFDLYPGGVYIGEASYKEYKIAIKEIEKSINKLKNTIYVILKRLNLKMKDCFIMGFSQGGIITFELARYLNDYLAGIGIISGRIIDKDEKPNNILKKTPIFISHGDQDDILPVSNFHKSTEYLNKYQYKFESHLIKGDTHTISPKTINIFQQFIKKNI